MTAEIVSTNTPALFASAVKQAAELLRAGGVVALPTETVYGLAANALDAAAVTRIYEAKGRPAQNPIIVHVASVGMAKACVVNWPERADKLAKAFWPGPLTLVLRMARQIPKIVTAGGPTVGIRWPSHPLIQAVIRECGFPLAAPSANPASCLSPTHADHVRRQLGDKIRLIVDGGPSQVGIESTVVDLTTEPPTALRPGMIHEESLLAVTGDLVSSQRTRLPGREALRSPGLMAKHYAPRAKLLLMNWRDNADLKSRLPSSAFQVHVIAHTHVPDGAGFAQVSVIPHDPEAFARAIYAELHRCDEAGADLILVESPPDTPQWRAIGDRLRRAAA